MQWSRSWASRTNTFSTASWTTSRRMPLYLVRRRGGRAKRSCRTLCSSSHRSGLMLICGWFWGNSTALKQLKKCQIKDDDIMDLLTHISCYPVLLKEWQTTWRLFMKSCCILRPYHTCPPQWVKFLYMNTAYLTFLSHRMSHYNHLAVALKGCVSGATIVGHTLPMKGLCYHLLPSFFRPWFRSDASHVDISSGERAEQALSEKLTFSFMDIDCRNLCTPWFNPQLILISLSYKSAFRACTGKERAGRSADLWVSCQGRNSV